MIYFVADKIADWLKNKNVEYSRDSVSYGLKYIINFVLCVMLPLIIGLIIEEFWNVLIALIVLGLMRYITGGIHLKSSDLCVLYTTGFVLFAVWISHYLVEYHFVISIISIILIVIFAPNFIGDNNKKNSIKVKLYGFLIAALLTITFQSPLISIILLLHSMHLINWK